MRDGSHIPTSEFHSRYELRKDEVDALWEKVKDNLDKALADLEKAGFFPPSYIVRL
jgi:hypothetical protein